MVQDDSAKQAWGVQLNEMESVAINKIEPWMKAEWPDKTQTHKVTLSINMSADSATGPIPIMVGRRS
jgi:hypothetical protein